MKDLELEEPTLTDIFAEDKTPQDLWEITRIFLRNNNPIVLSVDGKIRSGKSYFAKWYCSTFDKNFYTISTIKELLQIIRSGVTDHFILFDELEAEIPSTSYASSKNLAIRLILSVYGSRRLNLVITTPNVFLIDKQTRDFINFRVTMIKIMTMDGKHFIAYVRDKYFDEKAEKVRWKIPFHRIAVPYLDQDPIYEDKKWERQKEIFAQIDDMLEGRKRIVTPERIEEPWKLKP